MRVRVTSGGEEEGRGRQEPHEREREGNTEDGEGGEEEREREMHETREREGLMRGRGDVMYGDAEDVKGEGE